MLIRPGLEPTASRSADRRSPNWANRAAVELTGRLRCTFPNKGAYRGNTRSQQCKMIKILNKTRIVRIVSFQTSLRRSLDPRHYTSRPSFQMSDVEPRMSDVGCRMSDVGCRMSDVRSLMSDVGCRISDVRWRISDVRCRISDVECRMAPISFRSFLISSRQKKIKKLVQNFWTKLKAILWSLQTKKLFWNSLAYLQRMQNT